MSHAALQSLNSATFFVLELDIASQIRPEKVPKKNAELLRQQILRDNYKQLVLLYFSY